MGNLAGSDNKVYDSWPQDCECKPQGGDRVYLLKKKKKKFKMVNVVFYCIKKDFK